jgi:hypothetical protein
MNHVRLISAVRLSITLGKLLIIFHKLTPHPKQRFERRLQTQQMISLETPSIDVCNKWLLENLAKVYLAHLFLLRYKDKFFHCPDSFSPPGFCRPRRCQIFDKDENDSSQLQHTYATRYTPMFLGLPRWKSSSYRKNVSGGF